MWETAGGNGEVEYCSGNNIIGYPGNHMGIFPKRQPYSEPEEQDVPGMPDHHLCGHDKQHPVHLYAVPLHPLTPVADLGGYHGLFYTDSFNGPDLLSLCGLHHI